MAKAADLAQREAELLARIGREREALCVQLKTLRRPLRKVERVEQGLWRVDQRLQWLGGLRGLVLLVLPATLLAWRMRRYIHTGARIWGVWRLLRGLRRADVRHHLRPRRWPMHLLRIATAWRP